MPVTIYLHPSSLLKIVVASGNWQFIFILNVNPVNMAFHDSKQYVAFLFSIGNIPSQYFSIFRMELSFEAKMKYHIQAMAVEKLLTRYSKCIIRVCHLFSGFSTALLVVKCTPIILLGSSVYCVFTEPICVSINKHASSYKILHRLCSP
jgi:hypothetical protein